MNQPADNRGLQEFDDEIFSTLRGTYTFTDSTPIY